MRIAVSKRNKYNSSFATSVYTLLQAIGNSKGFDIQFAEHLDKAVIKEENIITFITHTPAFFSGKFFESLLLTSFIKKNKINLLIQDIPSFTRQKRIPQLLIADNIDKLPAVKKINYSNISLLTYSLHAKQAIIEKGFTNVVHVIPFFTNSFSQPITWSNKQQVKIDFTEGREYFITSHDFKDIDSILKLLKAFTGFKKWQQSSMKLVITGKLYMPQDDWEEKWSTYKYREDVLIYNKLPEKDKLNLLAGAYASIHLPENDNDVLPLLQSLQCHIPVITFETPTIKEYAANAVLMAPENNYTELTQQMILMYKDENLRNKLIEHCAIQANEYSQEKALQALQNVL